MEKGGVFTLVKNSISSHRVNLITKLQAVAKQSWMEYISTINPKTPPSLVFENPRRISGKYKTIEFYSLINNNNDTITDFYEILETLGDYFAETSSSSNYSPIFLPYKLAKDAEGLEIPIDNIESYNLPLILTELETALSECQGSIVEIRITLII